MRGEILRCPWRKWEKERTCLGGYFGGEDCCDFGRFVYFKMGVWWENGIFNWEFKVI